MTSRLSFVDRLRLVQRLVGIGTALLFLTGLMSPEEAEVLNGKVASRPGVAKRAPFPELLERINELIGA